MKLALIEENQLKEILRQVLDERLPKSETNVATEEPINQKSAAEFLGISQATIIKWKTSGKIPYEQVPGSSKVRFYKSQLKAVIQKNPHLLQASRR